MLLTVLGFLFGNCCFKCTQRTSQLYIKMWIFDRPFLHQRSHLLLSREHPHCYFCCIALPRVGNVPQKGLHGGKQNHFRKSYVHLGLNKKPLVCHSDAFLTELLVIQYHFKICTLSCSIDFIYIVQVQKSIGPQTKVELNIPQLILTKLDQSGTTRVLYFYPIEFYSNTQSWQCCHFLYCFIVKGKLIWAKSLPLVWIEPATPMS